MRGWFVTGTDTGVGKSVVTAALVAALTADGRRVRPFKPILTGLADPPDPVWPPDHELLALAAGCPSDDVVLRAYDPPVSPHLAAELAGRPVDAGELAETIGRRSTPAELTVVEGVGGLLVPLGGGWDVRRFAVALGLPLIVVARPGLGTINHTLLTLEAARTGGLRVAGVILNPWPEEPDVIERSNLTTIAALAEVPVATMPVVTAPAPEELAAAGRTLPLERWLLS